MATGETFVLLASSKSPNIFFKKMDTPDYMRCLGTEAYDEEKVVFNETTTIDL